MSTRTQDAAESVKEVASAAVDGASRKATEMADKVKEVGNRAAGYVRDQYDHLSEEAHDAYARAKNKAHDWEQSAEHFVQQRPLQTLLIAAGIGALLAMLWRRRD